jgi:hypothetical protein
VLTLGTLAIPKPLYVPSAGVQSSIASAIPAGPLTRIKVDVPVPVGLSSNAGTPTVSPSASPSSTSVSLFSSALGSLGGIVRTGIQAFVPGGGAVIAGYDALNSALGRTGAFSPPAPAPIAPAQRALPSGPMTAPNLPALPSQTGIVKIIPSQKGAVPAGQPGGFMITPGAGTHGHYTKKGLWSMRRRPRMNPMNVHAGRRAIRRIHAAEKLFHRFLAVTHPGHTGKVKVKRGR